jgi:hypothetical protein
MKQVGAEGIHPVVIPEFLAAAIGRADLTAFVTEGGPPEDAISRASAESAKDTVHLWFLSLMVVDASE